MNSKIITKGKRLVSVLALIFIAGFYLRIGGVLSGSFAFTYDVGRDMLQLSQILNSHKIPLIGPTTGLAGLYYGPWWYYILTPPFFISGGNPKGIAFFMVLTGLATILLGYILGQKASSKILGLMIAAFLSLSAAMVGFSTQIWNPNIIPPLLILVLILLLNTSSKRSFWLNVSLGFLLGLILDSEIVFGVLFTAGFVISYIYLFKKKTFNVNTLFIILGFLITFIPRIFFELRHQFIMTLSFFRPHEASQQILDLKDFFNVFPERISTIIGQFGDTFGINYQFSVILILGFIASWIYLRKKAKKTETDLIVICSVIIGIFILGSSIFARAVWSHYLVGLPVLYIIAVSLSLLLISRKYRLLSIAIFVILLFYSIKPEERIADFLNPNWEGNAAVYRNQVAVMDYIYKDAKGKDFNYIAYTPVVYDDTYQYLFDWYGKKEYGYSPSVDTQKLLYVIVEPDPGYEGRLRDWLKSRHGDGKTIKATDVKGGITVQTRIR